MQNNAELELTQVLSHQRRRGRCIQSADCSYDPVMKYKVKIVRGIHAGKYAIWSLEPATKEQKARGWKVRYTFVEFRDG